MTPITYKGYLKEALLYPTCWFAPRKTASKKFVIFGVPRSGTTLIVSLLDAMPAIHCEGELWAHPLRFPEHYIACRERLCPKEVFGFKLLITHFEKQKLENPGAFLQKLVGQGYQVISLARRNIYRAALSNLYAEHIGKAYLKKSDQKTQRSPMTVEPAVLLQKMRRFEYLIGRHAEALRGVPHLDIVYEDDLLETSAQQCTIQKISAYLSAPAVPVGSDLLRVTSDHVKDFVVNAEEIDAFVGTTEFARFLAS